MTNAEIKHVLMQKGVTHLFHANTVATACTFIENKGLLSRGAVKERGLFQTPQQTDETDEQVDVFYDIFFDSVDIHERGKRVNQYGPVVFVYSIDVLDSMSSDSIRITRSNPMYWNASMTEEEKYFLTEEELMSSYWRGRFEQHLTLRHQREHLAFDYLEKIIIDNPEIDPQGCVSKAKMHLQRLINESGYEIPLVVRSCPQNCSCREMYQTYNLGYIYYRFRISTEEE